MVILLLVAGALLLCSNAGAFEWLCREARALSAQALLIPPGPHLLQATREQRRQQWLKMLGLWPLPERTPLQATITGTLERDGYVVEKLHFQSLPHCYVPGNLYRPPRVEGRLPAVLYLTGHTRGKVNLIYQQQPRWFGCHGYIALVIDPIQLGESQGMHHGTHSKGRWDWVSRGYTPAGTEVWNAMRAIDYLQSRPDVDPERIGVTGLSGGGAISWDLAAADERVKCVAPVCQTGNVHSTICDRTIDGHCDCAFWINYYRWDTCDLGALIAPRPLLIASGADDALWRPYAFRETAHRIRRVYEQLGVPDNCQLVEDLDFHGYSPRLRRAIFEWFNLHLKGDAAPVTDDVTDYDEPEENLLVFGGKLPADDRMMTVEEVLTPVAQPPTLGSAEALQSWRSQTLQALRELTFRNTVIGRRPQVWDARDDGGSGGVLAYSYDFDGGDGVRCAVHLSLRKSDERPVPVLLGTLGEARSSYVGGWQTAPRVGEGLGFGVVEVRGTGASQMGEGIAWTVRRGAVMCGFTLPERQTQDLLAGVTLARSLPVVSQVAVFGRGSWAAHAIYAAALDEGISELVLDAPAATHTDPATPEFAGVLSICDLPQAAALVFPRPITFVGAIPDAYRWTVEAYTAAGMADRIRVIDTVAEWRPWGAAR